MSEILPLKSYNANITIDSDTEEYHEINQDAVLETTFFSPTKNINEFDFFTQYDVKLKDKGKGKKKKEKLKKSLTLMDIVNTELANTTPIIEENVITMINMKDDCNNLLFLENSSRLQDMLKRSRHTDVEHGWGLRPNSIRLNPVFPNVLENATNKDYTVNLYYQEPVIFNDLVAEYANTKDGHETFKFLDIVIQNMSFKYHHKFSLEKLLCVKLIEQYNKYLILEKSLKQVERDVKVSRDTKNNLKHQLLKITVDKKENIKYDRTIMNYTLKFLQLKEQYMDILKKYKETIHTLLSLWSDVELVRLKSGCTEVNCMLDLKKITSDKDEYEREWNHIFEVEYTDMLDKIEYKYANEYIEYKEAKNTLKSDSVEKRKLCKPKLKVDETKIKNEVEAKVDRIITRDKIDIVLKPDKRIMKDLLIPVNILLNNQYYFKIFVDDVFICESETYSCKDELYQFEISESFSVQILPKNKTVHIALYENDVKVSSVNINIIDIKKTITLSDPTPFYFIYSDNVVYPTNNHIGSGATIKEIAAENKVRLRSGNIFKGNLYSTYEVFIKMGWNEKLDQTHYETLISSIEVEQKLKRLLHGIEKPNISTLLDIIEKIYNKNVTDDVSIVNTLKDICKTTVKDDHTFGINENNPDFARFKLLHLRNNGGFVDIQNKQIPLFASQITTEQLSCLHKTKEKVTDFLNIDDENSEIDPIDLQRHIGSKYVQKLNQNMQRRLNEFLLKKTHRDVVKDFKDLSLRGLLSNQSSLMTIAASFTTRQQLLRENLAKEQEIRVNVLRAFNLPDRSTSILAENDDESERIAGFKIRPLRPYVKFTYNGSSVQSATGIGCHPSWSSKTLKIKTKFEPLSSIHVNVYDEYKMNISESGSEDQPSNSRTVQYRLCSRWLGTLQIPLYTVLALGTIRGTFKLITPPMIFGYENSSTKEVKSLIPEVSQLIKKDISFLTLHITTSLSHLGGVQTYSQPALNRSDNDHVIKHLNNFLTNYLNDFPSRSITLTYIDSSGRNKCVIEFPQPIPPPDFENLSKTVTNRLGSALSKSSSQSKSPSSKGSTKKKDVTNAYIDDDERESIYSGFAVNNWGSEESEFSKLVQACVRYVSLIPTYEVSESHVVTLFGIELLKVLHGSPLDHTILLASYFLYLGIQCWVITGLALPRGLSSYVLVKYDLVTGRIVMATDHLYRSRRFFNKSEDFVWYVYDAVAGERFELRDLSCPLKTVSYVFNSQNIWVNIQSSQNCESVSFDFTKTLNWLPVFNNDLLMVKQPLVVDSKLYSVAASVEGLRLTLDAKIKGKIQRWRSRVKTVWNRRPQRYIGRFVLRFCCNLLREALPQWEQWAFNPVDPRPEFGQRLKQLMQTYKMYGFPMNLPYVSTKSVVASVKAAAVHANDDPNVEFGLAVEVFAYPNNVISVWVFLVSITKI